jgi:hypothetical protein
MKLLGWIQKQIEHFETFHSLDNSDSDYYVCAHENEILELSVEENFVRAGLGEGHVGSIGKYKVYYVPEFCGENMELVLEDDKISIGCVFPDGSVINRQVTLVYA